MLQRHHQCCDLRKGYCISQFKDYGMTFEDVCRVGGGNILKVTTSLEDIIKLPQGEKRTSFPVISP